jgi:hypothetical protein
MNNWMNENAFFVKYHKPVKWIVPIILKTTLLNLIYWIGNNGCGFSSAWVCRFRSEWINGFYKNFMLESACISFFWMIQFI